MAVTYVVIGCVSILESILQTLRPAFSLSSLFRSSLANLPNYSEYFWERMLPCPARFPAGTRVLLDSQLSGLPVIGCFSDASLDVQPSLHKCTHTPPPPPLPPHTDYLPRLHRLSTYAGPSPPSWPPDVNLCRCIYIHSFICWGDKKAKPDVTTHSVGMTLPKTFCLRNTEMTQALIHPFSKSFELVNSTAWSYSILSYKIGIIPTHRASWQSSKYFKDPHICIRVYQKNSNIITRVI